MSDKTLGVVIGRFQVPELHEGHIALLDQVFTKHKKVLVLVGVSPVPCTRKNPLNYETRTRIILAKYPKAIVLPIVDCASDTIWSIEVDRLIQMIGGITTTMDDVTIYGGRDSFIPYYNGIYQTEEVKTDFEVSATSIRRDISKVVLDDRSFAAGAIWAIENQYPAVIPTVDIAIFEDMSLKRILLAKKPFESQFRFVGGFCDPTSRTMEADVRREATEEAGIEVGGIRYIASSNIDDWRYKGEKSQIRTTLFAAIRTHGKVVAGDDVRLVQWFDTPLDLNIFVPEHVELANTLNDWLTRQWEAAK